MISPKLLLASSCCAVLRSYRTPEHGAAVVCCAVLCCRCARISPFPFAVCVDVVVRLPSTTLVFGASVEELIYYTPTRLVGQGSEQGLRLCTAGVEITD